MSYVKSLKRERIRLARTSNRTMERIIESEDEAFDDVSVTMRSLNNHRNKIDRTLHKFNYDMDFLMDSDNWDEL